MGLPPDLDAKHIGPPAIVAPAVGRCPPAGLTGGLAGVAAGGLRTVPLVVAVARVGFVYLSVLCRHKQPSHHTNEAVNRHLNADSWHGKVLPTISSPAIAHHLFDLDACLYYVSGTGDYGLLAFDIDSDDGRTDALAFAREIQKRYLLAGCSFVQSSTSGNGAYLYVPVVLGTEMPRSRMNELCSDMGNIVKEEFAGQFKSHLDAIKGTFPVIEIGDDFCLHCRNQGVLVRAPIWETLEDLEVTVAGTGLVPFEELVALLGIGRKEISVPLSLGSPRALECPSSSLSSSALDTHADIHVGKVTSTPPLSLSPWRRTAKSIKAFRDSHQRDPRDFDEWNAYYESLGLNTGPARPNRQKRYELILSYLGPYKPHNSFSFEKYRWLSKYVTPALIASVKGKARDKITFEDLAIVQYATGLATITREKDPKRQYGLPLKRIAAVYKMLGKVGVIQGDYDLDLDALVSKLKSKFSIAKRILVTAGLIVCIDADWDEKEGKSKKYVVTERDEVFGAHAPKIEAASLPQRRTRTVPESPGFDL